MTGDKGERTVNGHLLCLQASIESLDLASSICNFKAPGRALKGCVHSACLFSLCVAHYSFVSLEWIVSIRALCAQSEGRRELHLDTRSQIIHLTLRQEGSTEHRRAKLKGWEGGEQGDKWETRARKTNKRFDGFNCKQVKGSSVHSSKQLLKDVSMTLNRLDWA